MCPMSKLTVLISPLLLAAFLQASCLFAEQPPNNPGELHERAVKLARDGDHDKAIGMLEEALKISGRDPKIVFDYMIVLSWAGRWEDAVTAFEALPSDAAVPADVKFVIAKCYRDGRKFEEAAALYSALSKDEKNFAEATAGLALTYVDRKDFASALRIVSEALGRNPDDRNLLFAKAQVHQEMKDYVQALKAYDRILAGDEVNQSVVNLKARLLSDMGASTPAQEFADSNNALITTDTRLHIDSNMAARRINWGEHRMATNILGRIIAEEPAPMERKRARFDRILALSAMEEMEAVLEAYDELIENEVDIPYWIHDAAATAYLFFREPKKAAKLYEQVLESKPDRFDTRLGLYFAYIESEDFKNAGKVRDKLEKETPEWVVERGLPRYNWNKQRVVLEKGWWLLYQNRLSEGQSFFEDQLERAPANLAARSGTGFAAAWRGWPHQALEDYDVLITMAGQLPFPVPEYVQEREVAAKNGRISALNDCYLREEARLYGQQLLERNPNNLHTVRINRQLDIQDSTEFYLDVVWVDEDPGVKETYLYAQLTQPVTPDLRVYAGWLDRRTYSVEDATSLEYNRASLGLDWNVLPELTFRGEFSQDRNSSSDKGLLTRLTWRANDYWNLEVGHNTFSLDVPVRARVEGIGGEETSASVKYRASEMFEARAVYALNDLDDGNKNESYSLYVERGLLSRAHWRTRLFLEGSEGRNARQDVGYFSPRSGTTYELTHLLEHTVYRRYERAFVHRLYLGIGRYDQSRYSPETIWDGRYEHDYAFSDKTVLLWGVNFRQRAYDSDKVDTLSWYLTFRQNF